MSSKSEREFNLVVFGATGFTGKYLVQQIVQTIKVGKSEPFTWAVAGRSTQKLEQILTEISEITETDLRPVVKIVADVGDEESLEKMAAQCDVVLNTVGPYAKYGESVIKACIAARTHHLDVSAETLNLTEMQLRYDKEAEAAGIYVVGSCGFDSIPSECGLNTLRQNFNGELNSVESYLSVGSHLWSSKVNYTSWTSLLDFYSQFNKLRPLLRELNPIDPPSLKYKVKRRFFPHRNNIGADGWCIPLPYPDTWAVEKSQNWFYQHEKRRPIQFVPYLKQSNIFLALCVLLGSLCYTLMFKIPGGLYLLKRFPTFFSVGAISKEGPTKEQMESFDFSCTLVGKGWGSKVNHGATKYSTPPDTTLILKMSGLNPAYGITSVCLIQSALTILFEKNFLPKRGGVFTPGVAFANTTLAQRLDKHGLKFEFFEE